MKIGILGHGEIGKSLEKIYKYFSKYDIKIKDLAKNDGFENIEVLNICIPNCGNFVEIVSNEIKKYHPKLTIIHSTIPPGTTKKIKNNLSGKDLISHSPVRGVHPNLYEGIKTFVKYIGAEDNLSAEETKKHFEELGINAWILKDSITTEIGKLLSTTYYALAISWHGEMKKLCDNYNINFDEAVTDFNESYNEGYKKLGKKNVIRPTLLPPENNKIGGHCLIPNAKILKEVWGSDALNLILKYSEEN